ncbi:MAG TPA: hypothetical protein VI455_01695 [Terriglobia bacterium]
MPCETGCNKIYVVYLDPTSIVEDNIENDRVSRHFKKEFTVTASVDQLPFRRTTEGNATKDEWPCMEPKVLFRLVPLLSNQGDSVKMLQALTLRL